MAGDLKLKYPGSSTLTVTNLHSLASSATRILGWSSASYDNTSALAKGCNYAGKLVSHASNRQAGVIDIYYIAALDGTPNWPAASAGTWGTEGSGTGFADTYRRDSMAELVKQIVVDNTASAVYDFALPGIELVFGFVPPYHCLFITQNAATTTQPGFAASGSVIYRTTSLDQYT
jgi:hypothetical protein